MPVNTIPALPKGETGNYDCSYYDTGVPSSLGSLSSMASLSTTGSARWYGEIIGRVSSLDTRAHYLHSFSTTALSRRAALFRCSATCLARGVPVLVVKGSYLVSISVLVLCPVVSTRKPPSPLPNFSSSVKSVDDDSMGNVFLGWDLIRPRKVTWSVCTPMHRV